MKITILHIFQVDQLNYAVIVKELSFLSAVKVRDYFQGRKKAGWPTKGVGCGGAHCLTPCAHACMEFSEASVLPRHRSFQTMWREGREAAGDGGKKAESENGQLS